MSVEVYRKLLTPAARSDPLRITDDTTSIELPLQTEFKDITEIWSEHQDNPDIAPTPQSYQYAKKQGKYEDSSLLLRRKKKYSKRRGLSHDTTQLEIRDPVILNALSRVLESVRYLNLQSTPLCLKEPFKELFWFRKELTDYQNRQNNDVEEQKSFDILFKFIEERLDKTIQDYQRMVPQGYISNHYMWTIFRPSSWVISMNSGIPEMYSVQSLEGSNGMCCLAWSCDSKSFGVSERKLRFGVFESERKITDLDVYPFESLSSEEQTTMYERMVARGKRWRNLTGLCHKFYDGVAWELKRKDNAPESEELLFDRSHDVSSYERIRRQVRGRVVLDYDTTMRFNPGSTYPLTRWTVLQNAESRLESTKSTCNGSLPRPDATAIVKKFERSSSYDISDQQAVISPSVVHGYSLEDKCWMEFDVEKVQDIQWEENCLDRLQVSPVVRNILDVLVKQHTVLSEGLRDVVPGKGQGLTFLLHGPPGSGKTLTAEVLSEHSRKPLLRITSGDLGTEPGAAEKKLQESFKLAQAWKAILLLDEADVFLAKRESGDIVRNAFITVFLRSMEYYAGIMLLTTNQKDAFDEAFQSRIHVQIPYLPATLEQRKAIWANIVAAQDVKTNLNEAAYERLARRHIRNGREIKNMVILALMISSARGVLLSENIVDEVGALDSRSQMESPVRRLTS